MLQVACYAVKRSSVYLLLFAVAVILFVPAVSLAADPIVPSCNTTIGDIPNPNGQGTHKGFTDPCGWNHLVKLGKNLLDFMIYIAVPIAAICFAWAGWLYLSARGNPGQISKAHGIFLNVTIGLVIVLVAWLVVDQIMKALVETGSYIPVLTQ